ncbi:MAG: undecaprenyl-diphosphate phosphatase [Eubacterium sp.]|nr:undecaprenyl-diphosphate phosphatase [Eubacterium sp.]
MSILKAIIQAILQVIFTILPVSVSAHSSAYHEFAHTADGTVSALTGIIHMGIAVGIIAASYTVFLHLAKEFAGTFGDMFSKRLKGSEKRPARRFLYFVLLSFAPLILWLIPFGKAGFLFSVLHKASYNGTLLDEGVFLLVTGGVLIAAARQLTLSRNDKDVTLVYAIIVGVLCLFCVPLSGFALIGIIFAVLILFGVSRRPALRYALTVTAPIYLVTGIVETCIGEDVGVIAGVLGAVIGALLSFVCVKVLRFIIKNDYLKYFAIYDLGFGFLIAVIGIFQLALN